MSTLLEVLRLLAAVLAGGQLLVMASRWHAWTVLAEPLRWLFLGLAGQAMHSVYATWELAAAGVPAGPRSCFAVVIQAWLLIGVLTYMPRRSRIRTRLRRWRSRTSAKGSP